MSLPTPASLMISSGSIPQKPGPSFRPTWKLPRRVNPLTTDWQRSPALVILPRIRPPDMDIQPLGHAADLGLRVRIGSGRDVEPKRPHLEPVVAGWADHLDSLGRDSKVWMRYAS